MGSHAITGLLTGGQAVLGLVEGHSARKRARREEQEYMNQQAENQRRLKGESDKLNERIMQQRHRIAVQQARSAKSRVRGGVFGETDPTQRTVSTTLG